MVAHELHHNLFKSLPASAVVGRQETTTPEWNLLEAHTELGGRLRNDNEGNRIDLGGAWIWPAHQPYMKRLVQRLSIPTFPQPDDSSSTRIDGGAVSIVHKLAESLPDDCIKLATPVTTVTLDNTTRISSDTDSDTDKDSNQKNGPVIRVDTKTGDTFLAKRVVVALPPRLVAKSITFDPPLPLEKQAAMQRSRTWMAGVTKVSLLFTNRFWSLETSNAGLPRGAGPAFQVYDASTKDGSVSALTFFALVPPGSALQKNDETLAQQCAKQLSKLWSYFGMDQQAAQVQKDFTGFHVQRWPQEAYISDEPEPAEIHPHPYPVQALSAPAWDGTLQFAGSETDRGSPGVMEGAVGSALRVVQSIRDSLLQEGEKTEPGSSKQCSESD